MATTGWTEKSFGDLELVGLKNFGKQGKILDRQGYTEHTIEEMERKYADSRWDDYYDSYENNFVPHGMYGGRFTDGYINYCKNAGITKLIHDAKLMAKAYPDRKYRFFTNGIGLAFIAKSPKLPHFPYSFTCFLKIMHEI